MREVEDPSKVKQPSDTEESSTPPIPTQVLYIQMEYCKNSTLRNLIDTEKLHSDTASIWRIFREILLGLQYIHHQNMIHRGTCLVREQTIDSLCARVLRTICYR